MKSNSQHSIHEIFADYFDDSALKKAAYLVSKKLEEGHICLDIENLNEEEKVDLEKLRNSPLVTSDPENNIQPFVLFNDKFYLQRYFYYESKILNKIKILSSNDKKEDRQKALTGIKDFVLNIFADNNNEKTPWQMIGSLGAVINNFMIITGGPGTGKTTTIAKFLAILYKLNPGLSIAITAPTGKAAARMNESLLNAGEKNENIPEEIKNKLKKISTSTIHRLLGGNFQGTHFRYNENNRLRHDVIIVDESSMIDAAMMSKLFEAVKDDGKLILLGDKNQLASVEAGSIFGDLCNTPEKTNLFCQEDIDFFNKFITGKKISSDHISENNNVLTGKVIELQHSYRFDENEDIGKFSSLVINGNTNPDLLIKPFKDCKAKNQCVKLSGNYNDREFYDLLKYYEEYAKEEDIEKAFEKLKKIMILCAVREGEYGYKAYNILVEKYLSSKGLIIPGNSFYDKQPVMITSNDYSLGVFNGDNGIIRENKKTGQKRIYFQDENGIKDFPVVNINSFQTAYAMTIHKSQGSEYDNVVIIIPDDENHKILSRQLLYTAVTRARKNVLILGNDNVIIESVKRKINRISGIRERILKG